MKRMMLRVAGLMVLFGALTVGTAHADSRFSIHVGIGAPPVVVAPAPAPYGYGGYDDGYYAPYPGYVWQPGYYVGYQWMPGAWVPRGRYVAAPYYSKHDWKRDRHDWERSRQNWERSRYNERDRRRW